MMNRVLHLTETPTPPIKLGQTHPWSRTPPAHTNCISVIALRLIPIIVLLGDMRLYQISLRRIQSSQFYGLPLGLILATADNARSFNVEVREISAGFAATRIQTYGSFELVANLLG